jgi:hypothetical protein
MYISSFGRSRRDDIVVGRSVMVAIGIVFEDVPELEAENKTWPQVKLEELPKRRGPE